MNEFVIQTSRCHFEDSKHAKHFEMAVCVDGKADWGVNYIVPVSHYRTLEKYVMDKVSKVEAIYLT